MVSDADCDINQRPFVFVHGTFGSATTSRTSRACSAMASSESDYRGRIQLPGDQPGTNGSPAAAIDKIPAETGSIRSTWPVIRKERTAVSISDAAHARRWRTTSISGSPNVVGGDAHSSPESTISAECPITPSVRP